MHAWVRAVAAALAVAASLVAQPARERLVGSVRTAAGAPWVAAEITLVARPIPWRTDLGELDCVVARSDRDGGFAVGLLPGLMYSAWASAPGAEGAVRFSAVVDEVAAGETPVLTELPRPRRPRQLHIAGMAPWQERGVRSARVVPALGCVVETGLPWPAADTLMVPPQPGDHAHVELAVGAVPVALVRIPGDDAEPALPTPVAVAAPQSVQLQVVGPDGTPRGDARLRLGPPGYAWQRGGNPFDPVRTAFAPLAVAAAAGTFGFHAPWSADAGAPCGALEITAPGCVTRVVAWPPAAGDGLAVEAAPDAVRVRVSLAAGALATGRVRDAAGQPVAGLRLDVAMLGRTLAEGRSAWCYLVPAPVATDADGRFVVPGVEPGQAFQVWALASDLRAWLTARGACAPVALLARGAPAQAGELDLGTLALEPRATLELTAVDQDGAPVPAPRVHLGLRDLPGPVPDNLHRRQWWSGDRSGRLSVFAARAAADLLVHAPAGRSGLAEWLPEAAAASRPDRLRCVLAPALAVTGVVRGADGKPVAGAALGLEQLREGPLPRSWRSQQALYELQDRWLAGTTDAAGRFTLRFVPMVGGQLVVRVRQGGGFVGTSLHLGAEPVADAELVVDGGDR